VTSAVIYRAFTASRDKAREYVSQLEKGQTGLIGLKAINTFPIEISYEGVKYSFQVNRNAADTYRLTINGKVSVILILFVKCTSFLFTCLIVVRKCDGAMNSCVQCTVAEAQCYS
jgi:hypothetical protein